MTACSFEPGTQFGELEVVKLHRSEPGVGQIWECVCLACGKKVYRSSSQLNHSAKKGHVQCCLSCNRQRYRGYYESIHEDIQQRRREMWGQYKTLYSPGYQRKLVTSIMEDLIRECGPLRDLGQDWQESDKWHTFTTQHISSPIPEAVPPEEIYEEDPAECLMFDEMLRERAKVREQNREPTIVRIQKYRRWPKDEKHLVQWAGRARIIDALIDSGVIECRNDDTRLVSTEEFAHLLVSFLKYFARNPKGRCPCKNDDEVRCRLLVGHDGKHVWTGKPARKPVGGPSIYSNTPPRRKELWEVALERRQGEV